MKSIKSDCKETCLTDNVLNRNIISSSHEFRCEICEKTFQFKGSYTDHLKVHANNEIKFECTDCTCFFKNRGHLRTHIREVHGPKKRILKCKNCSKVFEKKSTLTQHNRRVHGPPKTQLKCTFCENVYTNKNSLKWHVLLNHNKNFKRSKCPYCPADFKWPHHLKVHIKKDHIEKGHAPSDLLKTGLTSIRQRTNDCIVCNEKFIKKIDLMMHLKIVHKQDFDIFKCCICDAVFSIKNSLIFHLEEHTRKNTTNGHKCDRCYPEPNPVPFSENKVSETKDDDKNEIKREIIDFELTLMEYDDIRKLIKHRLRNRKRSKSKIENGETGETTVKPHDTEDKKEDSQNSVNSDAVQYLLENAVCLICNTNGCDCDNDKSLNDNSENMTLSALDKVIKICLDRVDEDPNDKSTKDTTFTCEICQSKFSLNSMLAQHMEISHSTNIGTHKVEKESNNQEITRNNRKTLHGHKFDSNRYECSLCKVTFKTPLKFGQHVRLKHSEGFKCNICKLNFKKHVQYVDHMTCHVKKVSCSKVKMLESSPKRPKVKTQLITPKRYECGKCAIFFNTKLELLRHISNIHMSNTPKKLHMSNTLEST